MINVHVDLNRGRVCVTATVDNEEGIVSEWLETCGEYHVGSLAGVGFVARAFCCLPGHLWCDQSCVRARYYLPGVGAVQDCPPDGATPEWPGVIAFPSSLGVDIVNEEKVAGA